jgi:DNA polymerase-3 subunit gamma/tau
MFDQLIAFAGKELTYDIVTEQLHVLDNDTYFEIVDFALNANIPDSLLLFDSVLARGFDAHHFLSGLGNHLRSLMVCRDPRTLKLMEATPEVKTKFSEQASIADLHFIVDALSITNEADTQYRTSQHQRLLVELAVMKICSLKTSSENPLPSVEKKKSFNELIPPDLTSVVEVKEKPKPIAKQAVSPVPVAKKVESGKLRGGGVKLAGKSKSLSETGKSDIDNKENEVDESWKEEVTIEKIKAAWDLFIDIHKKSKRVSLVSTLTMCELELKGNVVIFNVLNELQEVQLNDERTDLLFHLRKNVKNSLIELSIKVIPSEDGDDAPKIFLTDKERYMDMVKKNPSLDDLRKRLDLDLG